MKPTLLEGDFIFGYKLPFGARVPFTSQKVGGQGARRGEPVIFKCPLNLSQRCIKRVVGIAGDRIEIKGKRLWVNGEQAVYEKASEASVTGLVPLLEKMPGQGSRVILISGDRQRENFGPVMVPPGQFFVLGDNRDAGQDSRDWGAIPLSYLEARPLFIWLSFDWGQLNSPSSLPEVRWNRLFQRVD